MKYFLKHIVKESDMGKLNFGLYKKLAPLNENFIIYFGKAHGFGKNKIEGEDFYVSVQIPDDLRFAKILYMEKPMMGSNAYKDVESLLEKIVFDIAVKKLKEEK